MKNYIIAALTFMLALIIADNIDKSQKLEKLTKEHDILEEIGVVNVAEWDDGSKLLFIYGGNYEIGLAVNKDGVLFWNNISKIEHVADGSYGALGYCKNGKLAARPAGCFETPRFTHQPTTVRHFNLFE